MPTPKHKVQRMHRNARRAANKITAPGLSVCPRCNEEKLPHRVCKMCGYYKEISVLETSEE